MTKDSILGPDFPDAPNQEIEYLEIVFGNIEYLPKELIEKFPNLKTIALFENVRVERIHPNFSADGYEDIEGLVIVGGSPRIIKANALSKLRSLREFILGNTPLEVIEDEAFKNNPELQRVVFYGNKLKRLRKNIFLKNQKLLSVTFYKTKIKLVSEKLFGNQPDLLEVTLAQSKLLKVPRHFFRNNKKLKYVDFSSNKIEKIYRSSFVGPKFLELVDFRNNYCLNKLYHHNENMKQFEEDIEACY
jgi:Leucine-rich repeat (LRR) protein